ncbi:MAG: TldD/PmbA family protein [Crenarchaeota archaeon]|nr:TldD/PmbA family protein [Thermoproteota archaeon]MCR8453660.1 TldD/PmbA family protein [Thermoproteota archaeon]MCR8455361.1 TldD/PmbA family protein [Thermoproteota archaeon]MCR8462918.1 TldD/PmbA family protein [Thermoproteota archaeon]MCR8470390.1 TldD/PmbA family protein [Thermoproteota archaeon]
MNERINKLINIGEKIVSKRDELNVDDIEIYLYEADVFNSIVINNYVTSQSGVDAGVGIRVSIGKKVAFTSVSSIAEERILEAAKLAGKIAKVKEEDPNFTHLPDPMRGYERHGIFDAELASLNPEELADYVSKLVQESKRIQNLKKMSLHLTKGSYTYAVVSSRGVNVGDYGTMISTWYEIDLKRNDKIGKGIDFYISRKFDEEALFSTIPKAEAMAREGLEAKKIAGPLKCDAVIDPMILSSILWPLVYNVSALAVQEQRSRFIGMIDKQVANPNLTILDDGTLPDGLSTNISDDEGIPMQRKVIIDRGILKTYLYDTYTAYRENRPSTGNAKRRDYKSQPSPSQTNLVIESTTSKKLEDIIREIDKGILLRGIAMGSHLIDPIKGSMAITCLNALYIEGGEVRYPIEAVSMSADYFEFLRNMDTAGSDHRITPVGKLPTVVVRNVFFS